MLKEATSEKKVHAPLKEITLVGTPGAKSTSKHQNVIQVSPVIELSITPFYHFMSKAQG